MKDKVKYFDAHSHLHSDFFNKKENGQKIAEQMAGQKIYSTIIGVNFIDSEKAVKMAIKNENLFCSIGIHPADEEKENWNEKKFQKLFNENKKKIVCVGECGFDFYWPANDYKESLKLEIKKKYLKQLEGGKISKKEIKNILESEFSENYLEKISPEIERQKILFEKQIDFAVKNNLPLMLHIRSFRNSDAHKKAFEILDKKQSEYDGKIQADFHFFTEGPEIVAEIIKRDFMISLPGVITFADLDSSISVIPIENIMSETDSPFAAPVPFRGKINTPLYISEMIKKIAEVKSIPIENVREETVKNALKFFNIK